MTDKEISSMARNAGLPEPFVKSEQVKRFAFLVAEAERNACAQVVSSHMLSMSIDVGVAIALRRKKWSD
ncbi:hypothetical protein UFOVP1355_57 [uncultured Caudovirales phage]|uniref:Uncharacterized protein n=1 Tax=uncultured Caudovirales phage TaxID=2100421 RepID=A0A6J5S4G0_9CAUD|nr:hypothetical protein UFOVP1355_57 [uncultured Caudovirales phage]